MIKEISLKLNEEIKATKQFQEYQSLAKQVKKNEALKKQEEMLKAMQKQIVSMTYNQDEGVEIVKKNYKEALENYKNHPLIVNYRYALENLNELLQYVNDYINGGLK